MKKYTVAVTRVSFYTLPAESEDDAFARFCDGALDTLKPDDETTTNFEATEAA